MEKTYRVKKYTQEATMDCGLLPESDVKKLLKGYTYEPDFEMYFSKKANFAYTVEEVK